MHNYYEDLKIDGTYIDKDSLVTKRNKLKKYHNITLFKEDYYYDEPVYYNKIYYHNFTKSLPNVDCLSVTKEEAIFLLRFWDPWIGTKSDNTPNLGTRPSYDADIRGNQQYYELWPVDIWAARIILADLVVLRIRLIKSNARNVLCIVNLDTHFDRPIITENLNLMCKGIIRYDNMANSITRTNINNGVMNYQPGPYPPDLSVGGPILTSRIDNNWCKGGYNSYQENYIIFYLENQEVFNYKSELIPLDMPTNGVVLDGNKQRCLLKIRRI